MMTVPASSKTMPRVAVVGCGYWGKNLVRSFAELDALEALVDADEAACAALSAKHGGRLLSFDEVLNDSAIDAVAIATPASTHYQLAKAALEAGKHVFVEKPLALDTVEAAALCEIADRLDRRLMVGHLLQYHPVFMALAELVRNGTLGRLQYIYSNRLNLGKFRRVEDILWSFAPHDLSMILSLIGSEPDTVHAIGGYYLHKSIADVTTTHLSFPGGEQAHVFVSWLHPFKEQKLVVVGSDAMAVFDDGEVWKDKLRLYPHRVNWKDGIPTPEKADAVSIDVPETEPLREECRHFLDSVANGTRPRTDGREGLRVLKVLTRAAQSLTQSRQQSVPAVPETQPTSRIAGSHPGVTIHESAYVDRDVEIGAGSKIWHFSHILPNVSIGRNVVVGQNVVIGPKVTVGNDVKIQNNVSVYEGVTLEDGVFCGPSCVFTNVNNPRAEIVRRSEFKATMVRRGATIGANATIVCGHELGAYSFIAAGAVVASDVAPFALMAGVPARRIGWMSHAGRKLGPDLVCPETGRRYRETAPGNLEEIPS